MFFRLAPEKAGAHFEWKLKSWLNLSKKVEARSWGIRYHLWISWYVCNQLVNLNKRTFPPWLASSTWTPSRMQIAEKQWILPSTKPPIFFRLISVCGWSQLNKGLADALTMAVKYLSNTILALCKLLIFFTYWSHSLTVLRH